MKEPIKTWDQIRKRSINRHKSICEYCNIRKNADELDLHHKNPVGDREQKLMLACDLSWSPTMSIAGRPE
jgi:hypothetical protein